MDKILIVAATFFEIEPLMKELKPFPGNETSFLKSFSYKTIEIDIFITGAGMVNTAFFMGQLGNKKYSQAINAGVCGSFNFEIKNGDIVNITHDYFSEMGAEDGNDFLSIKQINLGDEIVINNNLIHNKIISKLKVAKGITVNTVHGNDVSIRQIVKRLNPDVESMEGAAFLTACKYYNWPCAQIRAVSNKVERRNKNNWNMPLAVKNLNEFLINYLNQL